MIKKDKHNMMNLTAATLWPFLDCLPLKCDGWLRKNRAPLLCPERSVHHLVISHCCYSKLVILGWQNIYSNSLTSKVENFRVDIAVLTAKICLYYEKISALKVEIYLTKMHLSYNYRLNNAVTIYGANVVGTIRCHFHFVALLTGGGQERGLR